MAANKMFPLERQQTIVDKLKEQPKLLVADLALEFNVSQFTIRADLDELEREGKLRRCHGGALAIERSGIVPNYDKRMGRMSVAKHAIGSFSAALVQEGDIIAVDTGTTTIELVRALPEDIDITLIVNDFAIADLAEERLTHARVLFLGGLVRRGYRYTYGHTVIDNLEPYRADKAFLSANGFTIAGGFTSEDPDQARIKRAYLQHASKRYALVDETKIGSVSFAKFAGVEEVDGIVTDTPPSADFIVQLEAVNDRIKVWATM